MARLANSAPPSSITCAPAGTITISLPQKASISSVISRPGSTASVRLTISAPKCEVSLVRRPATQRPDLITLLNRAATSARPPSTALASAASSAGRSRVSGARSPIVFAA